MLVVVFFLLGICSLMCVPSHNPTQPTRVMEDAVRTDEFVGSATAAMSNVWPWPLKHVRTSPCVKGHSVCVALKHGLVIVMGHSNFDYSDIELCLYSLRDGSFVRRISISTPKFYCGMALCPDGNSVLFPGVKCLQEVNIGDGLCMRSIGEDALENPVFVDCNADVIVVSERTFHRVCVFSYRTGYLLAKCGGKGVGPGRLKYPGAIRLSSNGREMVVNDSWNKRLCVFRTTGQIMHTQAVIRKHGETKDFLVCPTGLVAVQQRKLVKWSAAGNKVVGVYELHGDIKDTIALAALPDGGLIVRWYAQFEVLLGLDLRVDWMAACACLLRG